MGEENHEDVVSNEDGRTGLEGGIRKNRLNWNDKTPYVTRTEKGGG